MKNLVICGSGIKSLSHHTREFDAAVKGAEAVVYLVNEPLLELWLKENSKKSYSLNEIYFSCTERNIAYQLIVDKVLANFEVINNVCLVFYGHPLLLADSVNMIIDKARTKDISVQVLPGVSAFDCLLADLEIKLDGGCFLIEASYFIKNQVKINISSHAILWQVGMININSPPLGSQKGDFLKLQAELLKFYPKESIIYLYEASLYPHRKPLIIKTQIADLDEYNPSSLTSAYLPPII